MPTFRKGTILILAAALLTACGGGKGNTNSLPANTAAGVKDVAASRLNFRYEGDVPAPAADQQNTPEERSQVVQTDFDSNRPADEVLDKTISSPNQQNILAVWHHAGDADGESRLDMLTSAEIARERGFSDDGYRVVINTNSDGGQTVFHLHVHLLAGRPFVFPPG